MPNFSEIVDRAVFQRCGINVEPLCSWWRSPISNEQTNENLLKNSFADSLVGDGVWQCILALDRDDVGREVYAQWLGGAATAVQEPYRVQLNDSPLWLSWFSEAAEAIDLWRHCVAEQYNCCQEEGFLTGIEFIRSGLPALALLYWKRLRRAERHRIRRQRILHERAVFALKEAQELADALSVKLPPLAGLDTEASQQAIVGWYDDLRESAILEHFWRDHIEYLLRLQELDASSDVLALIRTAEKRGPVTSATVQKLLLANRTRTESLLHSLQSLT